MRRIKINVLSHLYVFWRQFTIHTYIRTTADGKGYIPISALLYRFDTTSILNVCRKFSNTKALRLYLNVGLCQWTLITIFRQFCQFFQTFFILVCFTRIIVSSYDLSAIILNEYINTYANTHINILLQTDALHGEEGGRLFQRWRLESVRQAVQPEQHDAVVRDRRIRTTQRPARILTHGWKKLDYRKHFLGFLCY